MKLGGENVRESGHLDPSFHVLNRSDHLSDDQFQPPCKDVPNSVPHDVAVECVARCEEVVSGMRTASSRVDNTDLDVLAPFELEELALGKLLGSGEFGDVYEIKAFSLSRNRSFKDDENEARHFLQQHTKREKTGDARYAIKHLRPALMASNKKFLIGAQDLALEAQLLASIQHPNIIKLRGLAAAGTAGFGTGLNTGYFLILDRLNETLQTRIVSWALKEKRNRSLAVKKITDRKGKKRKQFLADRLKVAFDIAGALDHLHKNFIVFRDLKPANLGFDIRGDIKLFDFGLAKELPPYPSTTHQTFKLSGAGSLRYMSPEVALLKPYNLKADVYSFSILLWEILSLQSPFRGYSPRMYLDGVVEEGERPRLDPKWPTPLQSLLRIGWSADASVRPVMQTYYNALRREVAQLRGGDEKDLEHTRRRSTHILKLPPL